MLKLALVFGDFANMKTITILKTMFLTVLMLLSASENYALKEVVVIDDGGWIGRQTMHLIQLSDGSQAIYITCDGVWGFC